MVYEEGLTETQGSTQVLLLPKETGQMEMAVLAHSRGTERTSSRQGMTRDLPRPKESRSSTEMRKKKNHIC